MVFVSMRQPECLFFKLHACSELWSGGVQEPLQEARGTFLSSSVWMGTPSFLVLFHDTPRQFTLTLSLLYAQGGLWVLLCLFGAGGFGVQLRLMFELVLGERH